MAGPDARMANGEVFAGLVVLQLVAVAVVAEHSCGSDAVRVEEAQRRAQERHRVLRTVTGAQLGVDQATGHLDRDVQVTPADPFLLTAVHLGAPAAAAVKTSQLFGVDRDQLTRGKVAKAPETAWRRGEQMTEAIGLMTTQDPVRRADRKTEDRADPVGSPALGQTQREH